jgi:hypothetical protein
MIQIGTGEEKIEAINALREFCEKTFGVRGDLADVVKFLDSLSILQEPLRRRARFELVGEPGMEKPGSE